MLNILYNNDNYANFLYLLASSSVLLVSSNYVKSQWYRKNNFTIKFVQNDPITTI